MYGKTKFKLFWELYNQIFLKIEHDMSPIIK